MPTDKEKEREKLERAAYCTDASMIEGNATKVIFPKSAEEIRQAIISNPGVSARGGGSGLVGGAVPQNCAVLDLSKMNHILGFDSKKNTVEVEAGVILDELNDFLDKYGLEFPVKPSSHSICTIGGMISTNAVGSRAVKYGRTSDWIRELEVVNGKGEILQAKRMDLGDFAGMEGITGVIVKAKLEVIEKKKRTVTLSRLDSLDDVERHVIQLKLRKDVSAIEFLDKFTSGLIGLQDGYHLIVEFESEEGRARDREYEKIMEMRDNIYPALASASYVHIEDPKILTHKFRELAEFLEEKKIPFFGHLGVGIIHPCFKQGQENIIAETMNLTKKLHGQVSGEHGIGLAKKEFLDDSEKKLIERIKKRHDPLGKLNCGKVIDFKSGGGNEEN